MTDGRRLFQDRRPELWLPLSRQSARSRLRTARRCGRHRRAAGAARRPHAAVRTRHADSRQGRTAGADVPDGDGGGARRRPARGPARPRTLWRSRFRGAASRRGRRATRRSQRRLSRQARIVRSRPRRPRTHRLALDRRSGARSARRRSPFSAKPRRSRTGTRAMASAPIAALRRGSPRRAGGANATFARPSISRAPILS